MDNRRGGNKENTMNLNNNKGFTILETLVSALLLALVLASISGLVQGSLQIARDYKDSITAAMLAQEGMEMVWERRDYNVKTFPTEPDRWLEGLTSVCNDSTQDCIAKLQSDGSVVFEMCAGSCANLLFDAARGVFNHNLGSITQFKRSIHVTLIGSDEAEVRALITWPGIVSSKSLLLETHLFQWRL